MSIYTNIHAHAFYGLALQGPALFSKTVHVHACVACLSPLRSVCVQLPFAVRLKGDMPFDNFGEGELEQRFTRRQGDDSTFVTDLFATGTELLGQLTYFHDPRREHQLIFHLGEGAAGRVYACSTEDGRPVVSANLEERHSRILSIM